MNPEWILRSMRSFGRVPTALFGVMGHREALRRWAAKHHPVEIVVHDFDGTLTFSCDLGEHIGSHIFWRDGYSRDQLAFLDRFLSQDMTFLDVGANQGEFAVFVAKRVRRGKVFALEPVRQNYQKLLRNLKDNQFDNVEAKMIGLGAKEERLPIYSRRGSFHDGTLHSGLPTIFSSPDHSQEIGVIELTTLDSLVESLQISHLDVVKLDIEGAELSTLRGGEAAIRRLRPCILVEVADENCRRAGHSAGYLAAHIQALGYELNSLDRNGMISRIDPTEIGSSRNLVCKPKV